MNWDISIKQTTIEFTKSRTSACLGHQGALALLPARESFPSPRASREKSSTNATPLHRWPWSTLNHDTWRNTSKSLSGWWFQPLWKILVNLDNHFQYMEKMFQTTNQLWFALKNDDDDDDDVDDDLWWWWSMVMMIYGDDDS